MSLFKPVWMGMDSKKALARIDQENNQNILMRAAREAPLAEVRIRAALKSGDQHLMAEVLAQCCADKVLDHRWKELVMQLIAGINDCRIVYELSLKLLHAKSIFLRDAINNKLQSVISEGFVEDDLLFLIATANGITGNRKAAAGRLRNQDLIVKIAKDPAGYSPVREIAVKRIADQDILAGIAVADNDSSIRMAALRSMTDQARIAAMVLEAEDSTVAEARLSVLTDTEQLVKVVSHTRYEKIKKFALERLGGYLCVSCNGIVWPQEGQTVSCICMYCQAENHQYKMCSDILESKDHESGSTWHECIRCGKKDNHRSHFQYTDW